MTITTPEDLKTQLSKGLDQLLDDLQREAGKAIEDAHTRAMEIAKQIAERDKELAMQQARYQERQRIIVMIDIELALLEGRDNSSLILKDLRERISERGTKR
jgi:LytS/YehU family sensor histidine kinase